MAVAHQCNDFQNKAQISNKYQQTFFKHSISFSNIYGYLVCNVDGKPGNGTEQGSCPEGGLCYADGRCGGK